jgi:hypothetical protein
MSGLRPRLWSPWAVLLAGPVVAMTYFWLVYLVAEVACAEELDLVGTTALGITIAAATAAGAALLVAYTWRARQLATGGDENQRFMATTGLMVLGLFALFLLFLAAPVIGMSLC